MPYATDAVSNMRQDNNSDKLVNLLSTGLCVLIAPVAAALSHWIESLYLVDLMGLPLLGLLAFHHLCNNPSAKVRRYSAGVLIGFAILLLWMIPRLLSEGGVGV